MVAAAKAAPGRAAKISQTITAARARARIFLLAFIIFPPSDLIRNFGIDFAAPRPSPAPHLHGQLAIDAE
jgi:hypothetical protein